MNYYNEIEPFAAKTLRSLIDRKLIPQGEVDERSIVDVKPSELTRYTQCHFFAGIGGWSYALELAGWPADRPVWTGSCPCQPYSTAGKGNGFDDERHLWPAWFHLIEQCRPSVIFGEQVTTAIKHGWLDLVQDDLEGIGYAVAPHGLSTELLGAPHQRKRLYFVADTPSDRRKRNERSLDIQAVHNRASQALAAWNGSSSPFADWKKLLAQPGTCRMADGVSSTVDIRPRLRGYGNAIVPQVAQVFIEAYMETV